MKLPHYELFCTVLNKSIYGLRIVGNNIEYDYENGMPLMSQGTINIHELASLAKGWAYTYHYYNNKVVHISNMTHGYDGFRIISGLTDFDYREKYFAKLPSIRNEIFLSDTEPEAVFKACDWILEEMQK